MSTERYVPLPDVEERTDGTIVFDKLALPKPLGTEQFSVHLRRLTNIRNLSHIGTLHVLGDTTGTRIGDNPQLGWLEAYSDNTGQLYEDIEAQATSLESLGAEVIRPQFPLAQIHLNRQDINRYANDLGSMIDLDAQARAMNRGLVEGLVEAGIRTQGTFRGAAVAVCSIASTVNQRHLIRPTEAVS